MNRRFNRRGLRAALILAAASAATLAAAGGSALAATSAPSQAAAGCVTKASTPLRVGHISGIGPAVPASAACQKANSDSRVLKAIKSAGDNAEGAPPLIWHGGAVMGTSQTGTLVITPIFWDPASNPMATSYKTLITQYLSDVAAASGSTTNVFSLLTQYTGSDGQVQYHVQLGTPINDTNPLPASACKVNVRDTRGIYADGSGYNACLDDAQVQAEVNAEIAAGGLPTNFAHIYEIYLPKGVESCFVSGVTTNTQKGTQACTINNQPSAAYCAYHSLAANNSTEYANMPFPIYLSATGFTCGTDVNFPGVIESPNNNPDADTEISPTSHETAELITDPDNNGVTASGWFDSAGFEIGDECAFIFGPTQGTAGALFNQVINGHHYLTQEEFSNSSFFASGGGCLQSSSET